LAELGDDGIGDGVDDFEAFFAACGEARVGEDFQVAAGVGLRGFEELGQQGDAAFAFEEVLEDAEPHGLA